jgi:GNAT superfamily N-acetyltransferase
LYYIKYSTWKGKCIYLDDIIVTESMRRKGIGKKLFEAVIAVANKMRVRKLEWQVLNWNKPAIGFYKKYSTVFDKEWVNCKLIFE